MGHILSSIPPNSGVRVWAQKRFSQYKGVVCAGAIRILATADAYPIRVTIRPSALKGGPGKFKNYGGIDDGALAGNRFGGEIDMDIAGPQEFYAAGSPEYLVSRNGRTVCRVEELAAPPNPATDIYKRLTCKAECGAVVEGRETCERCEALATAAIGPPLCTAWRDSPTGQRECTTPSIPHFDYCQEHAEARGLITPEIAVPTPEPNLAERQARPAPFGKPSAYEGKKGRHPASCRCTKHFKA